MPKRCFLNTLSYFFPCLKKNEPENCPALYKINSHNICDNVHEQYSVKNGFNTCAKSIDSDQPVRIAEAALHRYFFTIVRFLHVKRPVYLIIVQVGY